MVSDKRLVVPVAARGVSHSGGACRVGQGGYPSLAPHRSGRAELPHPALRATDLPREVGEGEVSSAAPAKETGAEAKRSTSSSTELAANDETTTSARKVEPHSGTG